MASKIDFSTLTLNSEEARETSELVFERAYNKPELNQVHEVMTGVEMDKYIPILGKFDLVGKIDPGSCAVNTNTSQIPSSEKQWTPKLISDRLIHCQADVETLLKFWKKSRIALKTWEDVDNEMMAFVTDRTLDAIYEAILRITSFGDTTNSPVGDGTGNELLTTGTDKTYFNMLNGLWQQIFTDQALATPLSYRYTIEENALGTEEAQLDLAADRALKVLRALYNNIPAEAHNTQLVYEVTRSLFNNWQDFMEDESLAFMLERTEDGATKWSYRGYPIIIRDDWDQNIKTYQDIGDTLYLPHRAILTAITNIPIGTSDSESLNDFDSFYNKVNKKHYIDMAFKLDIKVLLEAEIAVAY